ncbi:MAG: ABC transporter ATP-binding protein, partial [Firmicutes bacterium]|nr:ABC transporter ATP-binding protein [Bacillota bacterium]
MIKKLAQSLGEYKKTLWLTMLFVAIECVFDILLPRFMAKLVDLGIESGKVSNIFLYGALLLLTAVFALVTGIMNARFASISSAGFAKNLRRRIYAKVQTFSFSNIDRFSTSGLVTRMTTDVSNVQMAAQQIIRTVARAPLMIIFVLISAFSISARLSVVFLYFVPFAAVALILIMKITFPLMERVFSTYDGLNNVVQENVRAVRVVKDFVREDYETDKFTKVSGHIKNLFTRAEKLMALNRPVMQLTMNATFLMVAWVGARLIVSGGNDPANGMTTGYLMTMIAYTSQLLMNVMGISMIFAMLTISKASAERICEVLDEESTITNPDDPITEVRDGSIDFEKVCFSYQGEGGRQSLKEVDIHIDSGETVGIVGGTGSSKSTLVQLIPRLYDATAGTVRVGGEDVRSYDIDALRGAVAMVLQKNVLFSGTVRSNLLWGNENATEEQIVHACQVAQADEFVRSFPDGYDSVIEQGGTNVSGGQKQRLCIARALVGAPKILILDDSTSAVDTATDARIRKAFREELPDTTKIIITQRVASVEDADKIIVMDSGRVVACGTHQELLERNPIYREVYESQVKGAE